MHEIAAKSRLMLTVARPGPARPGGRPGPAWPGAET